MLKKTNEEIKTFMEELFGTDDIEISKVDKKLKVRIEQMYEYVDCSFANLTKVSQFFDTVNIDVDEWYSEGCPSCDYGSSYVKTLTIW